MYYKRNTEARSRNHCCHGKAISITYSEFVSMALVIQHTKRMRRIILSSVDYPDLHIFPHYLLNVAIVRKKVMEH
jgi:hypothetical protein